METLFYMFYRQPGDVWQIKIPGFLTACNTARTYSSAGPVRARRWRQCSCATGCVHRTHPVAQLASVFITLGCDKEQGNLSCGASFALAFMGG